jgi:hypothetical protein
MPRRGRYIPQGDGPIAVEVMTRCFQGRFFLACTTKPEARRIFDGVWAHALRKFPDVKLNSLVAQANHYHALLTLLRADPHLLADFMAMVNGNLARELNRILARSGTFWECRYSAFPVAQSHQEARLKYHWGNGVVSGDYASPVENPMPNTVSQMVFGRPPRKGIWIRRADFTRARRRGEDVTLDDFTDEIELPLYPLPVHAHLTAAERESRMRTLLKEAKAEAWAKRDKARIKLKKPGHIEKLKPLSKPGASKHSPVPFAMADPEQQKTWWTAYRAMQDQRWAALKKLAGGFASGDVVWPPSTPKPSALRAAEADLAPKARVAPT